MEKEYKVLNLFLVIYLSLFYMELMFKLLTFGLTSIFNISVIKIAILLVPLSVFLTIICKLFKKKKINFIIYLIIFFIISAWFSGSFVFKKVFNTFFSISIFKLSDQALAFKGTVILEIIENIYGILLMFIPYILTIIFNKKINFHRINKKNSLICLLLIIIYIPLFYLGIYKSSEENKLWYKIDNHALNVEKLGVSAATYLNIKREIFGFEEQFDFENISVDDNDNGNTPPEEIVYDYNTLDIDFDSLINNESNNTIKSMHEYFKNDTGTQKNKYTGMFEGKNLIVIMAESLNEIAIREDLTPTLYKLTHSGFVFNNFYTPVNLSTIGGEFQDLTGLFANLSDLSSYWRKGTNYFPFGLGTVFNNLNYNTRAYHANYGTFQDRNVYLKSIGFDYFLYRGNGLEDLMNCNLWPQSDLDLINSTYNEWINDEQFMTYYVSVSGHMPYTINGNNMSKKNWDLVKDLNLSDEAKGYLAANIELDKMVESLINKLTEAGKLDDTVIAIIPDHYPYDLDMDVINELSTYEKDSVIEVNHSSLIIWNNKMETVEVDKVASQLDFIPTLYNLFNIEYDSRLFMGKDILSDTEGIAYFTNLSWVTNKGRYYASNNKFVPNEGVEVSDDYVESVKKIVSNRINMSKKIIDTDYYRKVFK